MDDELRYMEEDRLREIDELDAQGDIYELDAQGDIYGLFAGDASDDMGLITADEIDRTTIRRAVHFNLEDDP